MAFFPDTSRGRWILGVRLAQSVLSIFSLFQLSIASAVGHEVRSTAQHGDVIEDYQNLIREGRKKLKEGDASLAARKFQRALDLAEATFSDLDFTAGLVYQDLASAYFEQRKIFETEKACRNAIRVWCHVSDLLDSKNLETSTEMREQVLRAGGKERLQLHVASGLTFACSTLCKIEPAFTTKELLRRASRFATKYQTTNSADERCLTLYMLSLLQYPEDLILARNCAESAANIARFAHDPDLAASVVRWLAKMCLVQADYLPCIKFASAALSIDRRLKGEHSHDEQQDLLLLARSAIGLGLKKEANEYLRVLDVSVNASPPTPERTHEILNEIAGFYLENGRFDESYRLYERCRRISRRIFDRNSSLYASDCQFLGWAAYKRGAIDEGLGQIRLAAEIKEKNGDASFDALQMLATIHLANGNREAARESIQAAAEKLQQYMSSSVPQLVTAQQANYLNALADPMINQLATVASVDVGDDQIYNYLLAFKGSLLSMLRLRADLERRTSRDPVLSELVQRLEKNRLALLAHRDSQDSGSSRKRAVLIEQREEIQRELMEMNSRNAPGVSESPGFSLSKLKDHLGESECLIDFYNFRPLGSSESYYEAFITRRNNSTRCLPLGNSAEIEACINRWLMSIRQGKYQVKALSKPQDSSEGVSEVRDAVIVGRTSSQPDLDEDIERKEIREKFGPILSEITSADSKIIVSCDGELYKVPWRLLLGLETKQMITQVDRPLDLVEFDESLNASAALRENSPNLLLVGNLDFSSTGYRDLKGSESEVIGISSIARKCRVLTKALTRRKASKTIFSDMAPSYRFVHLATHGLFLTSEKSDSDFSRPSVDWVYSRRNPLLDSAVILSPRGEAGIDSDSELSAEEVLKLDLGKTKQVVLSACETGLGEEFRGQGILGLRAAFICAGARTVLTSLWPVDDNATSELMVEYYSQLWERGKCPAAALAQAQEKVKLRHPAPYYWAGWVLVGEGW